MESKAKLILIDADVIIHLYKAERLSLLKILYPGRVFVLDYVLEELRSIAPEQVKMIMGLGLFQEFKFPTSDTDILFEYARLKQQKKGKGESACMAICRYKQNILASSNLKDIKAYCAEFNIEYLTTADIIAIAFLKEVISVAEADYAIYQIKSKGSKVCKFDQIEHFIKEEFDMKKLEY